MGTACICIGMYISLSLSRIRIINNTEPQLQVEGFANYTDVQASDLVPWTPLKAGYSHMDAESALLILRSVAPQFLSVVAAEASTLPEGEGECNETPATERFLSFSPQ